MPDTAAVWSAGQTRVARGLWVGRIFVRSTFDDEVALAADTGRVVSTTKRWILDITHIRVGIARCRTIDVALQIADELSRNAPEIHDASTIEELQACVPESLVQWLLYAQRCESNDVDGGEAPLSYREWRAK